MNFPSRTLILAALLAAGAASSARAGMPGESTVPTPLLGATQAANSDFVCDPAIPCGLILGTACSLIPDSLRRKYHLCEFG